MYFQYLEACNLYGWAMSQNFPMNGFKWEKNTSTYDEKFITNYDEDSNREYTLQVDLEYPKNLHDLNCDLSFIPQRIIRINKCNKLICNLYDKKKYVVHIIALKEELSHGIVLKKIYRVIKFNQEAWPKEDINMNAELKKQAKNDFDDE